MCNKAVDNYPHALEFVPEFYKTQKCVICHPSTIKFAPDSYKMQEICDKAIYRCLFVSDYVLIGMKLKECVKELFMKIFFDSILPF